MTSNTPSHDIRGVLIQIAGGRLLLPNATIAEVLSFADPDPVPAVAELRARGQVDSIPATRLVDEVTRDLYRAGP